jgi:translation elongation factor EF-4
MWPKLCEVDQEGQPCEPGARKRKLLEKQQEGKKKMRQFGKVAIPQDALVAALKVDG